MLDDKLSEEIRKFVEKKNPTGLLKWLQKKLKILPDSVELISSCANSLERLKEYAEAKKLYERILQIEPTNSSTYIELGHNAILLGECEDVVVSYFSKAIKLDPENAYCY